MTPDVLRPTAGPGRGLSLGKWEHLKWMTANTGPTDQWCPKPRTGSRNGRKRSGVPPSLRRPCLQASKINLHSQALHSLCSVTAAALLPYTRSPVIPGQQQEQLHATLSLEHGWILTAALRHVHHQHPSGSPNKGLEVQGEHIKKGKGGFPWCPVVQGTQSTFLFFSEPTS